MTLVLVHSPYSLKSRGGSHIGFSGGSRRGPPLPPTVLDQTEARRAEKSFWRQASSLILGLDDPPPPLPLLARGSQNLTSNKSLGLTPKL